MAFLPKNKYEILYTNGGEYRLVNSSTPYVGKYLKLYNGKTFAGDNISNPKGELVLINRGPTNNIKRDETNNRIYSVLQRTLVTKQDRYIPILTDSPLPKEEDYAKGFFIRYFTVRVNTKQYQEINKNTFENFYKRNYNKILNRVFSLKWFIDSNSELKNTNNLRIYESKLPGISKLLSNVTQYRRNNPSNPDVVENLVAQENELFFLDGTPYPAGLLYHIHPVQGPMEGGIHIPETHARLSFSSIPQIPDTQENNNGGSGY